MDWLKDKNNRPMVAVILAVVIVLLVVFVYQNGAWWLIVFAGCAWSGWQCSDAWGYGTARRGATGCSRTRPGRSSHRHARWSTDARRPVSGRRCASRSYGRWGSCAWWGSCARWGSCTWWGSCARSNCCARDGDGYVRGWRTGGDRQANGDRATGSIPAGGLQASSCCAQAYTPSGGSSDGPDSFGVAREHRCSDCTGGDSAC